MKKKVLNLKFPEPLILKFGDGEYGEVYIPCKSCWIKRLTANCKDIEELAIEQLLGEVLFRSFDTVRFLNKWRNNCLSGEREIESIRLGKPQKGLLSDRCLDEWLGKELFIIKLK